jgi:hypothetical protein
LVEMPNDEWVITDDGLDCLKDPYSIDWSQFDVENWSRQIASKAWADADKFDEAFNIARQLHGGPQRKGGP